MTAVTAITGHLNVEPAVLELPRALDAEQRALAATLHERLLREYDAEALERQARGETAERLETIVRTLVSDASGLFGEAKEALVRAVMDEVVGLGPIQQLVDDESISEVMVNAPDEVYVERDGVLLIAPVSFRDEAHITRVIDRIIAPLGRRIDESSPYVDARLADGSRVNAIIPPLAPRSPTLTIRKFQPNRHAIADLVENGTLTEALVDFLQACVGLRMNVVISGGSGTGKTTLLNALSTFIPATERVITVEDPIELKLLQRHVIALEARPASIEGKHEVTQRELVRNALRMRPNRIIVGEVRGPEAFDMMQAMNTGHEGSLTTVHANSTRDALARIENMVLMAGLDLPVRVIREQMASALHIIVQLARGSDGRRRVSAVSEVTGMEGDVVVSQDLFATSTEQGGGAALTPTGIAPTSDRLASAGIASVASVGRWS